MIFDFLLAISYNQPKFCPNAVWNSSAITFADNNTVGIQPIDVFVDRNNTVYVPNRQYHQIVIWYEGNNTLTKTIIANWLNPTSLFPTIDDQIYIDNTYSYGRIAKYSVNQSTVVPVMYVCSYCFDIFVSINNTLYCSMSYSHQVIAKSLDNVFSPLTIVAGTGTAGSSSSMLSSPYGIFVDINFDLYVADCDNDRVQLFHEGQTNGITVAGITAPGTFALNGPTAVVLDAENYLFITDFHTHRVVSSGLNGFRCLVGCSGGGSLANQLNGPRSLSFDIYGNIYVADHINNRIQKFPLATNSCGMFYPK